jgi:hypothetical protein
VISLLKRQILAIKTCLSFVLYDDAGAAGAGVVFSIVAFTSGKSSMLLF